MNILYIICGAVSAGLFVYLLIVLFKAEWF
jgi:K+-transporting ATPase KdpF subunit